MDDAIADIEKRGPGRPRTDATPVMVRLAPTDLAALDGWIAVQESPYSRPEAIRVLLRASLA